MRNVKNGASLYSLGMTNALRAIRAVFFLRVVAAWVTRVVFFFGVEADFVVLAPVALIGFFAVAIRSLSYSGRVNATTCLCYNQDMSSKRHKQRTYARNRAVSRRGYLRQGEADGRFILKLVAVVLLGSFWIKFHNAGTVGGPWLLGLPVGALVGFILIHKFEKIEYDRKIWYSTLVIVMIASVFLPSGIII